MKGAIFPVGMAAAFAVLAAASLLREPILLGSGLVCAGMAIALVVSFALARPKP